ncbi:MAG TPA: M23 family metallopeptidase [Miltoncostaeaceae bacterium]|nr:M23 family metallopeptidase [Miltoncostaeaceae bacterium]
MLRLGSRGPAVRLLQRELRRRGQRYVRVDGTFGPATRRAVRAVQRRLRLAPSGVADARLQRRLGLQLTAVAAGPVTDGGRYLRAFPVLGEYQYSDTWGAPRSQGGHEGTDIMAPRHSPLVAVAAGNITRLTRVETGLGGIYVWLRDRSGNEYYYAHMQSIAPDLTAGSPVVPGQVIGTVGNSGDARRTATHVHFEIHPRGGHAVPSYPDLRAVDPRA